MLKLIKTLLPETQVCYNITKGEQLTLEEFLKIKDLDKSSFKPDLINLRSDLITNKFIKKCHQNNIIALAWDFINYKNPVEKIKSLIDQGIDGILFDDFRNIRIINEYLYTS